MMNYTTEEPRLAEWENGGHYDDKPQAYAQFKPASFVARWRTPLLIIRGQQDFRVLDTWKLAARFTV
jgi:dipeptidyl aminopeptidase/acylaminoacyl peptidase